MAWIWAWASSEVSGEVAFTEMELRAPYPDRVSCTAVAGAITRSSESCGPVEPFSVRIPTTVKSLPLRDTVLSRIVLPSPPARSSATVVPTRATRRCSV